MNNLQTNDDYWEKEERRSLFKSDLTSRNEMQCQLNLWFERMLNDDLVASMEKFDMILDKLSLCDIEDLYREEIL